MGKQRGFGEAEHPPPLSPAHSPHPTPVSGGLQCPEPSEALENPLAFIKRARVSQGWPVVWEKSSTLDRAQGLMLALHTDPQQGHS